jgi:hypothetical protein
MIVFACFHFKYCPLARFSHLITQALIYYTIHSVLAELLDAQDVGYILAPFVTGPQALHRGFQLFMKDAGVEVRSGIGTKPAKAGLWVGSNNRTITVVGKGEDENEYVIREAIRRERKMAEYASMGMKHFSAENEIGQKSCLRTMWDAQQRSHETMPKPLIVKQRM